MTQLDMRERHEPKFVKFSDGLVVSGALVGIEAVTINGKQTARYVVQDLDTGELSAFLGTAQINARLRRTDLGHAIEVRCEGEDKNISKNGNPMKLFKVLVSTEKVAEGSAIITDDDIGF